MSYSDGGDTHDTALLVLMMLLNAAFVPLVVLGWPVMAEALANPIEWGMGAATSNRLDLTARPYATLWLLPLLGCGLGWLGMRYRLLALARIASFGPALLLGSTFAWYYLAPIAWR